MRAAIYIFEDPGFQFKIGEFSGFLSSPVVTHGDHGPEALTVTIERPPIVAYQLYDTIAGGYIRLTWGGDVFAGKIEDRSVVERGIKLTALGWWRVLHYARYTRHWSTTRHDIFKVMPENAGLRHQPEKFKHQKRSDGLYLTYPRGLVGSQDIGGFTYSTPDTATGDRDVQVVAYDFDVDSALNFQFSVTVSDDVAGSVNTLQTWAGWVGRGSYCHFVSPAAGRTRVDFRILINGTYNQDPGFYFLRVWNVRIATSQTYKVNTTMTANAGPGTDLTVGVVSTAGMYPGQRLYVANKQSIVVNSITSATQFKADLPELILNFTAVSAPLIYPHEIIRDAYNTAYTLNSDHLQAPGAVNAMPNPEIDRTDAVYMDSSAADVINNQTPPGWRSEITTDRYLDFHEITTAREWLVFEMGRELKHSLSKLTNKVAGQYKDGLGRRQVTLFEEDLNSISRWGVTVEAVIGSGQNGAGAASIDVDNYLATNSQPAPQTAIRVERIYTRAMAPADPLSVRVGDLITVLNIPPGLGTEIDRLRRFYVAAIKHDISAGIIELMPGARPIDMSTVAARTLIGIDLIPIESPITVDPNNLPPFAF